MNLFVLCADIICVLAGVSFVLFLACVRNRKKGAIIALFSAVLFLAWLWVGIDLLLPTKLSYQHSSLYFVGGVIICSVGYLLSQAKKQFESEMSHEREEG